MLQTTSPSYPILSSLDYARIYGEDIYGDPAIAGRVADLKEYICNHTPLSVLDNQDIYKLFLCCDRCNLSAAEIQGILERDYHIYIEGVFGNNLLLMFSPCNTHEEMDILEQAFRAIPLAERKVLSQIVVPVLKLEQALSPREAFYREGERVPLKCAVGRISKENITQFPPCIPIVTMGERISEEAILRIEKDWIEVVK